MEDDDPVVAAWREKCRNAKSPETLALELNPDQIDHVLDMTYGKYGSHSGVAGCIYLLGQMRPKGWDLNDAKGCLDWLWEVSDRLEGRVLRTTPPPTQEPSPPPSTQPVDMVTVVGLDRSERRIPREQYLAEQRAQRIREIELRATVALREVMQRGVCSRNVLSQDQVLVHADGGDCHGTRLEAYPDGGRYCPKCGISPDMQSIELWPREQAR